MSFLDTDLARALLHHADRAAIGVGPAHDALHVRRVARTAEQLANAVEADVAIAVSAALLHELLNLPKNHPDSPRSGEICAEAAARVLQDEGRPAPFIEAVAYAIRVHPFSLGVIPDTLEAKVLQDADRLDAIGAIGIARCFATCTEMGRPFYSPEDPFCESRVPADKEWGIDHFFTKLLRVHERLNTDAARAIARERTAFLRSYLSALGREIDGR